MGNGGGIPAGGTSAYFPGVIPWSMITTGCSQRIVDGGVTLLLSAARVTALMTPLMPGAGPPPTMIPRRLDMTNPS